MRLLDGCFRINLCLLHIPKQFVLQLKHCFPWLEEHEVQLVLRFDNTLHLLESGAEDEDLTGKFNEIRSDDKYKRKESRIGKGSNWIEISNGKSVSTHTGGGPN